MCDIQRMSLRHIKHLACFIGIVIGLCGCKSLTVYHGWGIVNNTDYILVIYQDGKMVAKMPPGTVTRLEQPVFAGESSLVSVSAYNGESDYRGANSYTFSKFAPYNWQINHVHKQEDTR